MTTPTKEQIEKMLWNMGYPHIDECVINASLRIITEWEKIKDLDARVEKMCKNNPGIKDFEDFYKARNSPK